MRTSVLHVVVACLQLHATGDLVLADVVEGGCHSPALTNARKRRLRLALVAERVEQVGEAALATRASDRTEKPALDVAASAVGSYRLCPKVGHLELGKAKEDPPPLPRLVATMQPLRLHHLHGGGTTAASS